jgi:hypothetical protein
MPGESTLAQPIVYRRHASFSLRSGVQSVIDLRFSPDTFEHATGSGPEALATILQDLEGELAAAALPAAQAALAEAATRLNALGHEMVVKDTEFYDEDTRAFATEWAEGEPKRHLRLWVSLNVLASAGYAGLERADIPETEDAGAE